MEMSDSFIDDLAAQTTLEDQFIVIPNVESLTEDQRAAVWQRAEQRLMQAPPSNEALLTRLQDMTPPIDEDEDDEETRRAEAEARHNLEQDGCPPCYPASLEAPVRNPPEEYRAVIEYWESKSAWAGATLCVQLGDWRHFRKGQLWYRWRYPDGKFTRYVEKVRERLRRHGLPDDGVELCLDPKEQTRAQDWLEFQYYHFHYFEAEEKEREELARKLEEKEKIPGARDSERTFAAIPTTVSDGVKEVLDEGARNNAQIIAHRLMVADQSLERYRNLLRWIEMQKQAMRGDDAADDLGAPSSLSRNRRKRKAESSGARDAVRFSKRLQEKRTAKPWVDSIPKSSRGSRAPERKRTRSRPVDVSPPIPLAVTRTRSGRISKPPVRWVP